MTLDAFGIGSAVMGAARTYFTSARRTGRTTALLASLKPGDRVVCLSEKDARRLQQLAKVQGFDGLTFVPVPPEKRDLLYQIGTSPGRTIFDHRWLEKYYLDAIEQLQSEVDGIQTSLSGYGAEHIRTRLHAVELSKWRDS